ncbi:hypothetical protein VaNZ11_010931 [Volvox africanus]|uniref:ubiquitinyl hydrolase 1 n=1 Tax=Volvox africanus TaxID=51714 RepID=A0ABQ5SBU3_9CHLO|nr:hypothetical protein VaNZ11_010931 [Volvox africanus]
MERDGRRAAVALGAPKACRTIVEDLFLGRWQSQVRCLVCGHESNTYESFTTVPLDIGQARSVAEALRAFTEAERLDGKNKYRCEKCRALVPALKQTTIWDEPNVLVLQLKRFNGASLCGKITRHVAFPDVVNLRPFMTPSAARHNTEQQQQPQQAADTGSGDDQHQHQSQGQHAHLIGRGSGRLDNVGQRPQHHSMELDTAVGSDGGVHNVYTLTGVLVHQGTSLHSGHYYALVRDSYGDWSCMNDNNVYGTCLEQVQQEQAYLLFYTRQRMKLPRPPPVPPPAIAAMDAEPIPWAGAGNTSASAAESTAGPAARQVYGPQLPANIVRGSAANGNAALREGTLPVRPSRLNPATMPSARLPAKVAIWPEAASIAAVDAGTASTAELAPAAKPVANGRADSRGVSCRPGTTTGSTRRDATSAGPVLATRGSGGSLGAAFIRADTLAAGKRSHLPDNGGGDEASRADTGSAAGPGNASSIPSADVRMGAKGAYERVQQELEGLKACAFYSKGIKRVKQSLEEQLRASSLREAIRETVIHMMRDEGMGLEEVLAVRDGDPWRKVLRRAVPPGILQYGMDELLKLHESLLIPAGLPDSPLS